MVLVGVLLALPGGAWAQAPLVDRKEMAGRQGEEGLALYAKGRFDEAYARFATGERIQHSPVLVLWMGHSRRSAGRLVAARALYRRVAGEALDADASPKWHTARDEARRELAAIDVRIPRLRVTVVGARGGPAVARLDGKRVALGTAVPVDPGVHRVLATDGAGRRLEKQVDVPEGKEHAVELVFAAAPQAAPGSVIPGAVVTSLGLAGLVAGGITGALALSMASEVKDGCVGSRCRPEDEGKADDADTLARVSTAALVLGGAITATGVVLLVVRPGGDATAMIGPSGVAMVIDY
jgi:hypothetical protein